jgi:LCP family protein required for cell wall assembly
MLEPEEYNVLHIGPEHSSPLDRQLIKEAKKTRLTKIVVGVTGGLILLTVFVLGQSVRTDLDSNEQQIESLIDEVGSLNQANFNLQQQVSSQDAVLKGLADDFTGLGTAIQGGDKSEIASLFTNILQKFSESHSTTNLSTDVSAAEGTDNTYDVLILGTNGSLTDTIMVASVNEEKEKISLFSVPRDLYINGRRINEYYHSYGVDTLERMVESVTGLTIDHYVQVDLQGFVEVVDLLGGLDIYVDENIYDGLYPNGKGGYDAYSITVGQYHMDGTEALKYARSRKSTSDFDRAARQQKIIAALRTKITQMDGVMEMKDLTSIFQTGITYTNTDLNLLDIVSNYYDYQDYDLSTGFVLTSSNYLYSMINESGAYILLPKTGNYDEIHQVISQLVN